MKSAFLTKHWPDSVTVTVTERTALAAVESGSPGPRAWALIDVTGRVLAYQASRPAGMLALSVPLPPGAPASDLPPIDEAGVQIAASMPPLLAERVRSVVVSEGDLVTLGLTGGVTALVGTPTGLQAKYEALASVVAAAPLANGDVVDVSVPTEPTVGPPTPSTGVPPTARGVS